MTEDRQKLVKLDFGDDDDDDDYNSVSTTSSTSTFSTTSCSDSNYFDVQEYELAEKEFIMNPIDCSVVVEGEKPSMTESCIWDVVVPYDEGDEKAVAHEIFKNLRKGFKNSSHFVSGRPNRNFEWKLPSVSEIRTICKGAIELLKKEDVLLTIDLMPCYILGDIHGNFGDLYEFLDKTGLIHCGLFVPSKFLFLGDFVDRGLHDVECVLLLLCLKILYPEKVYFLRGNHEWLGTSAGMSDISFLQHVKERYPEHDEEVTDMFFEVFSYLSLAAIVDKKILCVHGGIPRAFASRPELNILDVVRLMKKPIVGDYTPFSDPFIIFDLLWSDPASSSSVPAPDVLPKGFRTSTRDGDGPITACTFEKETLTQFLEKYQLKMLVRAHQCVSAGSSVVNNRQMITLFSSSGYSLSNNAAVLLVYNNKIHFLTLLFDLGSGRLQSY